ncbi:MAG: hypothetical protein JJU37_01565, partial [Balneolaceae bacterium]|nr:hypothetical protein [Balneolaceae bacterium]
MNDWKTYLLKYKWIPTSVLIEKFDLKKYDIDNYRRKPKIQAILKPWRLSYDQSRDRLHEIFVDAWRYYLNEICHIDFKSNKKKWVPELISLKGISLKEAGLSFLSNSKYLEIISPKLLEEYRSHGFTNIALGAFYFWPGKDFLMSNSVLPYM